MESEIANEFEVGDCRPDNTYTYSVKDPRSDKERYIRAAPIDLR